MLLRPARRLGRAGVKRLALLDVDGTLTDTVAVDLRCFLATLAELFGFSATPEDYDWEAVPHATDPGLLEAAFAQFAGRPPERRERDGFVESFMGALEAAAGREPAGFRAICGAGELLDALVDSPDWNIAIATGCWLESARFKLTRAALDRAGEPLATASEAVSREEIFSLARDRAAARGASGAAVLVGDGTWDAVTARRLDLPFVGVARGEKAGELTRLGAVAVVPDFGDLEITLDALAEATRGG